MSYNPRFTTMTHENIRPDSLGQDNEVKELERISVTALNVAGLRTFSDITYSWDIYNTALKLWLEEGHPPPKIKKPREYAPAQEIRYLLTTDLIKEEGNKQVLDIGAGLITRGITLTEQDTSIRYVELDLPVMANLKNRVINKMVANDQLAAKSSNLHIVAGNALDPDSLMQTTQQYFKAGSPMTILTEGVLHYFDHSEKAILANNIRAVLDHSEGGVWITDMPTVEGLREKESIMARTTSVQSGRSVPANRFQTHQEAKDFFADRGLLVRELRPFSSVYDRLTSPSHPELNVHRAEVAKANDPWSLWVITRMPPSLPKG
jgi:hypothetical protein